MSTKHCRFCGGKVFSDAVECKHCGKTLAVKKNADHDEQIGLTNINSWEGKMVPSWVMYAVVAFGLFLLFLFVLQGWWDPAPPEALE